MKFSKKRAIIGLIIILAVIVGFVLVKKGGRETDYEFVIANRGNIIREVSATGTVKAAQTVDLAFESSGKVGQIFIKVGDKIAVGSRLITLENSVLSAQLAQAQANFEAEQARLNELKSGTRPEEIKAAETAVQNADRALKDAEINLTNVRAKADADLSSDYDAALAALQKSVSVGKTALITITDIQYARFWGSGENENRLADAKAAAVSSLLGASGAGRWTSEYITPLKAGAFGRAQSAVNDPNNHNLIDTALQSAAFALQAVKTALDAVPSTDDLTAVQKTNLSAEKINIAAEITVISGKAQDNAVQKISNQNAIATAQEKLNTAQSALLSAQDALALKRAGSTPEQIAAQAAKVKSAQANAQNYQAQIAKTILYSPISGVVTKQEAEPGEIVAANSALVSVMSEADYEIQANIAEVDIAAIVVGNEAKITLDAYGSDNIFSAKVIAVDPSETMIEGVSTYKTTLQFVNEDKRIRPGMTANIDILIDKRENVLVIPQRAVARKNGEKIARLLDGDTIREIVVETGLRGSDGNIEIINGIKQGDKVITFVK